MRAALVALAALLAASALHAQHPRQTQADDYTRYELLDPAAHAFLIVYDVSATAPRATVFFNALRAGSEHEVHRVLDRMTGAELKWSIVKGSVARGEGLPSAPADNDYLRIELPRRVPEGGEVRLRIEKTYRDSASYSAQGDSLLFSRSLGIDRNAVVLPAGYELTAVNHPSQVITEQDGRLKVSFINRGPAAVPYTVRARRLPQRDSLGVGQQTSPEIEPLMGASPNTGARVRYQPSERAYQDREIVYFLQPPETHSFSLYHDYTETRPGTDRYLNVVRGGSRVSNPSAVMLDTGDRLRVETLRGAEIAARGIDIGETPGPSSEVVVVWFDPVKPDHSVRLRISETYTDPNRYLLVGDELVWDRAFGRPRNALVLPAGWTIMINDVPAVVTQTSDGRTRLDYVNDGPGDIRVYVRARRR